MTGSKEFWEFWNCNFQTQFYCIHAKFLLTTVQFRNKCEKQRVENQCEIKSR